jgi:hypothetical protein
LVQAVTRLKKMENVNINFLLDLKKDLKRKKEIMSQAQEAMILEEQ